MTLSEISRQISSRLASSPGFDTRKAAQIKDIIIEDYLGYTRTGAVIHGDRTLMPETVEALGRLTQRIIDGEPVQYVLGRCRFMGLTLKVTPHVLIPRPETAALVDMVTDDFATRSDLKVLDICTGSGCIALALARALRFADVTAMDISPEAIAVAEENNRALHTSVTFVTGDALTLEPPAEPLYDIIVSNPPYIPENERQEVAPDVLAHEPWTALFVPEDKPLLFYSAIVRYAAKALRPGGALYFEINPHFATSVKKTLFQAGFADIDVSRDFNGLQRFVRARLK